jgi:hypothetical protein
MDLTPMLIFHVRVKFIYKKMRILKELQDRPSTVWMTEDSTVKKLRL